MDSRVACEAQDYPPPPTCDDGVDSLVQFEAFGKPQMLQMVSSSSDIERLD